MSKPNKKDCLMAGIVVAFLSFVLLFAGVGLVLRNEIVTKNVIMFAGFSTLAGAIAALLKTFEFRIVYTSFIIGLAVGFLLMYRVFLQDISGWGNLIGLISMLMFTAISLILGASIQLGYHLLKKYKL